MWAVVILLSIFGLLAVYSSTGTLAYKKQGGNTEFYLFKHLSFLTFGLILMYLSHLVNFKYYSRISQILLILSFVLLPYTLFFGTDINDARRWITLPVIGFTFQTSDLAKLALIMYVARFLSKRQDEIKDFKKSFLPVTITIALICALIMPANLSTALVLFATCLLLMFIGRIAFKHILLVVGSGALAATVLVVMALTLPDDALSKIARLKTWKHRIEHFAARDNGPVDEREALQTDYQVVQAKIAIASGGLIGKGPGNSTQRNFLPHPYSDFVFAIILEEYGLIGASFLILLYLVLLFRCIRIVIRSPRAFGALLAVGLSFSLVIQAFINMGVAVNIFPVTGLPLPLVSMGGTSLIFTSMAFGIILSVSRDVEEKESLEKQEEGGEVATA
ncbi:putative peptidoglycan glycosyltransferase FtsW [Oscillatoria amoena NRMC-F 0135]|nr:putative peptidoglycan glycosyltransferase FtsW [Oscillatoria amoena NRMC-F 0135]